LADTAAGDDPAVRRQLAGVEVPLTFEDDNLDVLQNIEATILAIYKDDKGLMDREIGDALDALIRQYKWEMESRGTPKARLFGRSPRVFEAVRQICEWRLGRALGPGEVGPPPAPCAPDVMLQCLQRIRSSVNLWNKEFGRQGYLNYVSQYVR
jgi:hypothetical protein